MLDMFGWFKTKEESFEIKVNRSGKEVVLAEQREMEFLNKANTCPECNHISNRPEIGVRGEGDGYKYKVYKKCRLCRCEWTYERPYKF